MNHSQTRQLPLYLQIKELLLREMGTGKWLRGERLPTEAELAKQLGVAVGTLRKSLAALEQAGVLERRQGSGTYVAGDAKGQSIYHFFRLEKPNGQTGLPSAKVISLDLLPAPPSAQALALPDGTLFWRINRLRKLDGQAVALESIYLPQARAPELNIADLHESLYLYYRERLGFWIAQVVDAVSVGQVPDWGAKQLGLACGSVCGLVERVAYDQHAQRSEFSLTWFNTATTRYMARWA